MLNTKKNKRFIILYKKYKETGLIKQIKVITEKTEKEAVIKLCKQEQLNNIKIQKDEKREGWVYCNEIYNPLIDDTISNKEDNDI